MSRARGSRGGRTKAQPWTPFAVAQLPDEAVLRLEAEGWKPGSYSVFRNNRYQVYMRGHTVDRAVLVVPDQLIIHLSIKRLDRNPVRDWRHLQRIKNELVGKECEAVELYPAESRLIDEANQYHLYVVPNRRFRFPFGGQERFVGGPEAAAEVGAKQRAFEQEHNDRAISLLEQKGRGLPVNESQITEMSGEGWSISVLGDTDRIIG